MDSCHDRNELKESILISSALVQPALGYRGSVFNLVYDTNIASLAIWQRLGFTTVGKIPKAGLMRRKPGVVAAEAGSDGQEEEYVDAWM